MAVLNGLSKIASYCCVSRTKVSELIEDGIIPCIVKDGTKKRYSTYTFLVDFIREQILNKPDFEFNLNQSKNILTNQIFTKYPLQKEDIFSFDDKPATVFANANLKGGVGKTTTTVSLASALSIMGAKVLVLETDPQSNMSMFLGINPQEKCFSDVVIDFISSGKIIDLKECITNVEFTNSKFDALISDDRMLGKIEKISDSNFVRNVTYRLRKEYDFIIIDTPPSIQASLHQSYIASEFINLIAEPENLSVSGVRNLLSAIEELNDENVNNGRLEDICLLKYAVVTMFDARILNDQVKNLLILEESLERFDIDSEHIFKIKKSIVFPESTSQDAQCPIYDFSKQYNRAVEDGSTYFEMALSILKGRIGNAG